jgi:hypothetical protein
MTERTALQINSGAGAPFVRNFSALEHMERRADSYVDLQYDEHRNPAYVRVTARNRHPQKAIRAYFYMVHDNGGHFIPDTTPGNTIKACLKPSETTVIHFLEKTPAARLFLFNASFTEQM